MLLDFIYAQLFGRHVYYVQKHALTNKYCFKNVFECPDPSFDVEKNQLLNLKKIFYPFSQQSNTILNMKKQNRSHNYLNPNLAGYFLKNHHYHTLFPLNHLATPLAKTISKQHFIIHEFIEKAPLSIQQLSDLSIRMTEKDLNYINPLFLNKNSMYISLNSLI